MRFAVLGSGSGGNATVIECEGKTLLVDAGMSAKQLGERLEKLGVDPGKLTGIFLTHEHGDHVRGLDVFLRRWPTPVIASQMTSHVVQEKMKSQAEWVLFQSGQSFTWEGFEVRTFGLPHDAVEPVGYVVTKGGPTVGIATDLGHVSPEVLQCLHGVEGLVLEANYEWKMLEADAKRPFSTKQRIASKHGHLSNEQAGELVSQLLAEGLQKVVLAHLSSDCNCPQTAMRVMREKAGDDFEMICATQEEVTVWQDLSPAPDLSFYGELFAHAQ